jgi:hypothetical protein
MFKLEYPQAHTCTYTLHVTGTIQAPDDQMLEGILDMQQPEIYLVS